MLLAPLNRACSAGLSGSPWASFCSGVAYLATTEGSLALSSSSAGMAMLAISVPLPRACQAALEEASSLRSQLSCSVPIIARSPL